MVRDHCRGRSRREGEADEGELEGEAVVVQTGLVPLVLRRGNKYQFIRVLMGRTQGSGQSWTQEERGGLPQSRLGATGVVRGQRPGGGWASPKAQTRVVVTGGKTKHASGGRRWRAAVAGGGNRSFSSDRFSRPVTQEARPPADGTGRGRQRSEDRGGGQEGGWEMRIARTVKGPLEICATRFT